MSRLWLSPEASAVYHQTLERAASRQFIIEWSSQEEAEAAITRTFFTAACASEIAEGRTRDLDEERVLDLAEARLAAAALNRAADGDYLIAADEARAANLRLQETIGTMAAAPILGRDHLEYLTSQTAERARGWRRISDLSVAREIRALLRSREVSDLDPRDGIDPIDTLFAAYILNYEVGGADERIGFNDAMWASGNMERAMQGLRTYYR